MTAPVARPSRHVPAARAAVLTYRALVRQVITPGKLFALGALGALMILVGWLVGLAGADEGLSGAQLLRDGAAYADGFGLIILVPIVSLVFGSSVLGEAREDGTLVYLWLRPMNRAPVAVGAAAAAATAALPLTVIPTVLGGWLAADRVAGSGGPAARRAGRGRARHGRVLVAVRSGGPAPQEADPVGSRLRAAVGGPGCGARRLRGPPVAEGLHPVGAEPPRRDRLRLRLLHDHDRACGSGCGIGRRA